MSGQRILSSQISQPLRYSALSLIVVFSALFTVGNSSEVVARELAKPQPAPEFTQTAPSDWINSAPVSLNELRGKVVLIDFWTFECWNCYRSFPWLNQVEEKFKSAGLQVIGVHTPEFEHEKEAKAVSKKVASFELKHPTMLDNDFVYWRAMKNKYWPAYYLIDGEGKIRYRFIGETHANTQKAKKIEAAIEKLIAELSDETIGTAD